MTESVMNFSNARKILNGVAQIIPLPFHFLQRPASVRTVTHLASKLLRLMAEPLNHHEAESPALLCLWHMVGFIEKRSGCGLAAREGAQL